MNKDEFRKKLIKAVGNVPPPECYIEVISEAIMQLLPEEEGARDEINEMRAQADFEDHLRDKE